MLAQFFSSRKGAPHPLPTTTLDSTTEESHTRYLLYPDPATALSHNDGQPYPLHGAALNLGSGHDGPLPEIDLDFPRDCRIIIAQDEFMSTPKSILFDSKPSPPRAESPTQPQARARVFSGAGSASTAGPTFGGMHARRSSLVTESSTPRSPTAGAFTRARTRGNSISSMPNIDEHAQAQAQAQAHAQGKASESMDVVRTCLDCMFGNTTMSYRGNSNKLHIVPLDSRTTDPSSLLAPVPDSASSFGKGEGFRRRSHLANSFTPGNPPTEPSRPESKDGPSKEPPRRTIFITRMFSVVVPEDDQDTSNVPTPTPQSSLGKSNGFPFPRTNSKPGAPKPPQPPQTRKTPMYAIAVILHLPVSSNMRPSSRTGHAARGSNHMSTSAPGQDSLGSSFDSERRAGWTAIDSNFGVDSLLSTSLNSDVDDRVDVIGQHWDVITRTLTSLQHVVQERILAHFKAMEANSPSLAQLPRNQPSRYMARDGALPPARRGWRLQPNALAFDQVIKEAVERAGTRVVSGMRIPRVMTGQGKWGVWREEARWLGRWAGGRDQNYFLFTLLTAFLGNHTEWLNILGPKLHRKRHRDQQKSNMCDNLTIRNRTVIVSPDKMAARRLIFLLATFLPSSTSSTFYDTASPMRPSTSASLRAYSQSPPTNMPPSRKHSLRRQINRRPRGKQSLTNMRGQLQTTGATGLASLEPPNGRSDPGPAEFQEASRHSRRSSAHSIQTGLMFPSMSDSVTTKSSTATMSTVTPQNTVPVAHFTLPRTKSSGPSPESQYRPESSDSLASANLMYNLKRSSTGHTSNPSTDSGNTSRWSGFMSFWSGGRRDSSTEHSDYLQTTDDGFGISGQGYRVPDRPRSQLEQMVHELSMSRETFEESDVCEPSTMQTNTADNSPETYPLVGSSGIPPSAARPIPERPKHFDSTLKLSVNEKDGCIDVDIPLPDFGSPLQSPLLGGYPVPSSQPGSSFGESSVLSMPYAEPDQPVNAAGWLKQFHPDFAIQAIKPYSDLDRDIKRAMSAEPTPLASAATPTLEQGPQERWIDVCSALVADTSAFTIKRIRLRRLVKFIPTPTYHQPALTPGIAGLSGRSQYGNPYSTGLAGPVMTEVHLDERFTEEHIMDVDATLIDAVERVLVNSNQGTRVHSASSSRSSSRRGRDTRSGSDAGHHHHETGHIDCKSIIFDALETVVKDVTSERNAKVSKPDNYGNKNPNIDDAVKTATDSSLKDGIRQWLAEVE
ncbi:hypothetical protein K491DRAFT_676104 [Lophiostoma macrostomum CBS 122681]|uniref:Folliculin-interacting protein N-terminal domain-containing protein n=1 Tax=Lophiostoma macrostomum CBS 122681 TaxID=1314788 RepID=A0A6A6THP7_9PLEO|nr:hypothetical protein K491DRAFT_676104 [Lophiostoma macrostomum CBS 122681]